MGTKQEIFEKIALATMKVAKLTPPEKIRLEA
jgi:hypothetical protein